MSISAAGARRRRRPEQNRTDRTAIRRQAPEQLGWPMGVVEGPASPNIPRLRQRLQRLSRPGTLEARRVAPAEATSIAAVTLSESPAVNFTS
jgi:hypothetical protein